MSDMFRRITNNGPIQVVGDAAMKVDQAPNPVNYIEQAYDVAEEVQLGLGGRFAIAAAPSAVQSTVQPLPSPNLALPFATQRATIPSAVALFLMISAAKIAATDLIDGDPICADIFSEVSLNNGVRWPTANTGQTIRMTLDNTSTVGPVEPRMSLTGVRLR